MPALSVPVSAGAAASTGSAPAVASFGAVRVAAAGGAAGRDALGAGAVSAASLCFAGFPAAVAAPLAGTVFLADCPVDGFLAGDFLAAGFSERALLAALGPAPLLARPRAGDLPELSELSELGTRFSPLFQPAIAGLSILNPTYGRADVRSRPP